MICSNCGADIGDNETACPYCGAMQYENSEQKYMKDLYNLNEGMEKLDKNSRKYIIKSTMKSVGIVCAAIAAAVLAGSMFGYGSYKSMYNSSHNRKEIHQSLDWYNNNIGELNSLYEKRDYAGISELTDSYKGSSSVLEKWSHYNFINIYDYYYKRVADIYIMVHKGEKLSDYQFGTGFEESLDMIYFINNKNGYNYRRYDGCTAEEKETVDGWVAKHRIILRMLQRRRTKKLMICLMNCIRMAIMITSLERATKSHFIKNIMKEGTTDEM